MFRLFRAELKRSWTQLRRYASELIAGIVATTVVFYGLFLSAQYVAGPSFQMGDRVDAIIVGYVLWSLVLFVLSDIAGGLQREAQTGTLEQLFLSPFGAPTVFVVRALASLTIQLSLNLVILLIIMALTGSRLSFPPTLVLPLATIILGAYGVALGMGAVALLLKQVQQLLGILNFGLLFVLTVPVESWAGSAQVLGWLLPMTPGATLLRSLMAQGQPLSWPLLALALLNGVVYFGLGFWLFHQAEQQAKLRGKLGGY